MTWNSLEEDQDIILLWKISPSLQKNPCFPICFLLLLLFCASEESVLTYQIKDFAYYLKDLNKKS